MALAVGKRDMRTDSQVRVGSGKQGVARPLVLIVDDDLGLRLTYGEHLRQLGFRVAEAEDGAAALEKVRALKPSLVLLDYRMPVMDGLETARHLRAASATRHIALVLVTSDADCDASALFDRRLAKPCTPAELAATVEALT